MSKFKERRSLSWEGMFYSIQRIDLLIVSICSAGIYVSLETIKYTIEKNMSTPHLIKIAGVLFVLGIIINLLSQFFGHKSNLYDFLMCDTEIEIEENQNESKNTSLREESGKYDRMSEFYSRITNISNILSLVLMSTGLFLLMKYFLFNL